MIYVRMVSMEPMPTTTCLWVVEQGRIGAYIHPALTIRPCSTQARDFGIGAERAAARGYIVLDSDDSGGKEDAAGRGRTGTGAAVPATASAEARVIPHPQSGCHGTG